MNSRNSSSTSSIDEPFDLIKSQQEELAEWEARYGRFKQVEDEEGFAISREVSDRIFNLVRSHDIDKARREDPSPEVFMAVLRKERASVFYRGIADRLVHNEKVTAEEYLYYALTTDNVMTLDLDTLKVARGICDYQNYRPNLDILSTILAWHQEKDPEKKKTLNKGFLKQLRIRRDHCNADSEVFLNLAGVDLGHADLYHARFEYVDMGNADLSRTNLDDVHFVYANLDGADFRSLECKDNGSVHLSSASARKANLFNLGPHHALYSTTPLAMLERVRDELLSSLQLHLP